MFRHLIIFIIALLLPSVVMAQQVEGEDLDYSVESISALGLPVVIINTVDGEEPTCDMVSAPPGEWGMTSINNTKVNGRIQVLKDGDVVYDSGEYAEDESGMTIRIRGNTSAQWNKKPFKIKLEQAADLLFRGDDKYVDKDWLLLTCSDMLLEVGTRVNELCGLQWTPSFKRVNMIMNGDYRGIYTLMESVKRNPNCRLDVDKSTGYIFERDPYWWSENVYVTTSTNRKYTFKYPKDDEINSDQLDYIRNQMDIVEQAIDKGNYPDYIDVESFASWLLGHDILVTYDAGGSNVYLTKYDNTPDSKVKMANMWDFDTILKQSTSSLSRIRDIDFFYYPSLLNSPNKLFIRVYKQKWEEFKERIDDDLYAYFEDRLQSAEFQGINASNPYDMGRWNYNDAIAMEDMWKDCHRFLKSHFVYLDKYITELDGSDNYDAGIEEIPGVDETDGALYNINGMRMQVDNVPPGIYIRNGKKIIVR